MAVYPSKVISTGHSQTCPEVTARASLNEALTT